MAHYDEGKICRLRRSCTISRYYQLRWRKLPSTEDGICARFARPSANGAEVIKRSTNLYDDEVGWVIDGRHVATTIHPSFARLSRSAFITTVNDDNAIAAPANIGDINIPETGYRTPAATGTPIPLNRNEKNRF